MLAKETSQQSLEAKNTSSQFKSKEHRHLSKTPGTQMHQDCLWTQHSKGLSSTPNWTHPPPSAPLATPSSCHPEV